MMVLSDPPIIRNGFHERNNSFFLFISIADEQNRAFVDAGGLDELIRLAQSTDASVQRRAVAAIATLVKSRFV